MIHFVIHVSYIIKLVNTSPSMYHTYFFHLKIEGRWLHSREELDSYSRFWFTEYGAPHSSQYSFWPADAILARSMVTGKLILDLLSSMKTVYHILFSMKTVDHTFYSQ